MEPFVRWILAGGMTLVVGLWVSMLAASWSTPWLAGAMGSLLGITGIAVGLRRQLVF
ncbi:hypothetical protein [Halocatena halophila]|uniref:hypothetical protein n=1 Tax=Halocatena halophila TaxID=2814576 RepID=UPI002ED6446D